MPFHVSLNYHYGRYILFIIKFSVCLIFVYFLEKNKYDYQVIQNHAHSKQSTLLLLPHLHHHPSQTIPLQHQTLLFYI